MRRIWVLLVLAGCYDPKVGVGGACGPGDICPSGQQCYGGRCLLGPPGEDAALDSAIDAEVLIDAPADAKTDAPPTDAFVSPTWLTPTQIPGVNISGVSETDPSFTPDRKTIAFSRAGELYIGTRANTSSAYTVSALAVLDSAADEVSPEISSDGKTIYFTADRTTTGSGDVYVSTFSGGAWAAPTLVAELSSAGDDSDLAVSADGLTAIVSRGGVLLKATRATTAAAWGTPAAMGIAGSNNASPALNAAGDVYFHTGNVRDLMVARKQGAGYAAATAIAELNTSSRDAAPFVSADDLFMYFEHDGDLYETHR